MKKYTILLFFIMGSVFASDYCPPDVSKSCFNSMPRSMNYEVKVFKCSNVADKCFKDLTKYYNIEKSIYQCKNVAASCYQEISKKGHRGFHQNLKARKLCENVSNKCYAIQSAVGYSIKDTLKYCFDERVRCNHCSK